MKRKVQRMCAICNERKEKNELIRLVKQDKITVDITGKMQGRGAYICYDKKCLDKAIKTKKLEKILDGIIENNIYEEIRIITENKDCGGDIIG